MLPGVAASSATTDHASFTSYFNTSGQPLCGGEIVDFSGRVHVLQELVADGSGGEHFLYHLNFEGITGVGEQTGTKYQMNEADHISAEATSGATDQTFTVDGELLGQGPATNTVVHMVFHVTLDANGQPTAIVDHTDISCR